jgi:hypothetical protein
MQAQSSCLAAVATRTTLQTGGCGTPLPSLQKGKTRRNKMKYIDFPVVPLQKYALIFLSFHFFGTCLQGLAELAERETNKFAPGILVFTFHEQKVVGSGDVLGRHSEAPGVGREQQHVCPVCRCSNSGYEKKRFKHLWMADGKQNMLLPSRRVTLVKGSPQIVRLC